MNPTIWQPVSIEAAGNQAHLKRAWQCDPAWSVYAKHREPDGEIPHPTRGKQYVFWNRHLDDRFTIDYPRSRKDRPRTVGKTIGDSAKEWDVVEATRDGYLADAGLTLESPQEQIARCLADTFNANSYFKDKSSCTAWGEPTRELTHPVEGLLHQSFCVGCAHAYAAMADMSGLDCRTIGCGEHRVAEVRVDGRWHLVENSSRHQDTADLGTYMPTSFMEMTLDPAAYPEVVPERKVGDYLSMPNPQFHFMGGSWQCPKTLRFAGSCARAVYPKVKKIGFKSLYGKLVPLVCRSEGFYWEDLASGVEPMRAADMARRHRVTPFSIEPDQLAVDYLYHAFDPGARIRQSVRLDDLDIVEGLVVEIPFAPEPTVDFGDSLGSQLTLKVNEMTATLKALGAWPPAERNSRGMRVVSVEVPREALLGNAVNWIELRNGSAQTMQAAFIPAAMEPYIAPLAWG